MMLQIVMGIGYVFAGMVVDSAIRESWQKPSIIGVLFWPATVCVLAVFGLIGFAMIIGEKIREIINR